VPLILGSLTGSTKARPNAHCFPLTVPYFLLQSCILKFAKYSRIAQHRLMAAYQSPLSFLLLTSQAPLRSGHVTDFQSIECEYPCVHFQAWPRQPPCMPSSFAPSHGSEQWRGCFKVCVQRWESPPARTAKLTHSPKSPSGLLDEPEDNFCLDGVRK
jgi:hypothetical protein